MKVRRRGSALGEAKDSFHGKGLALMSQENQITLRGYLTAEPKLYQKTPQAVPVTELRVGCTPRRLNHETGEWQDLATSYYQVKCWRRLAINAVSSLHKGDQVLIRGRFYMNNWVDNQQRPRSTLEIEADTLGHDLAYGWSHYLRGTRLSGNRAAVNAGEMARQETESPDHADGDEYPPDVNAGRADESAETAAETTAQAADGEGTEDGGPEDGGTAPAAEAPPLDWSSDASSGESDPAPEESVAIPF